MAENIEFKSPGQQVVEARFGRPIRDLLRQMYVDDHRTQEDIARTLGVSRLTVARWMRTLGIRSRYLGSRKAS